MGARRDRYPLFDSLRAVAALSVVAYHVGFNGLLRTDPGSPLRAFAVHLDVGVPIFFLISGFLLYRPFAVARLEGRPPLDANAYGWRRILRIVPAYWVALTATALVAGTAGVLSLKGLPAYYGFLQIYNPDTARGGIDSAWSLCVEVSFYVFLPLWAWLMRRASPRGGVRSELVALGVLYAASVAYQVLSVSRADPNLFGGAAAPWLDPLPSYLDQFAVGMAVAVMTVAAQRSRRPWAVATVLRRRPAIGLALAAGGFWVMSTQIGLDGTPGELTAGNYLARHQLNTVVALGLLLTTLCSVPGRGLCGRVLALRPLLWLGTVSYGVFLWHTPVFEQLWAWGLGPGSALERGAWVVSGTVLTLALATLSFRWVERPALALAARLGTGTRGRSAPPAPQAEVRAASV